MVIQALRTNEGQIEVDRGRKKIESYFNFIKTGAYLQYIFAIR